MQVIHFRDDEDGYAAWLFLRAHASALRPKQATS